MKITPLVAAIVFGGTGCTAAFVAGNAAEQNARREEAQRAREQWEADRAQRQAAEEKALFEQRQRLEQKAAESNQKEAERRQQAEEAAEREEQRKKDLAEAEEDPEVMRAVWSLVICYWADVRADALREIAAEKKYSKIGGAVNLARLHGEQDRIRVADERTERAKSALGDFRAKPLSCKHKGFRDLMPCMHAVADCSEGAEMMRELARRADGYLR
jgi:hypothetical protein